MYCTNNVDAEDLFQDILLQLWKAWPSFKGSSKVSTWMYKVSLNTSIIRLRKNSRSPKLQELSFVQHTIPEQESGRMDILFNKELQKAISNLNKLDKALVMLYLDEKTYKEISEIMGMSENNIGVKINRIKKKLKEKMNA
jgi:RNA polymerase sigma-70 factor (ECF subfamily)